MEKNEVTIPELPVRETTDEEDKEILLAMARAEFEVASKTIKNLNWESFKIGFAVGFKDGVITTSNQMKPFFEQVDQLHDTIGKTKRTN